MNITPFTFPNLGFLQFELDEEQLLPIKNEVNGIQNNFDKSIKCNKSLAGHIDKEYKLIECREHIGNIIYPLVEKYFYNFGSLEYCDNILTSGVPLILQNCWVNFQKKHEFNPLHDHSGIFSFVIWIKIPYDVIEEKKVYNEMNEKKNLTSSFVFHYSNILGMIRNYPIFTDKSYEGKGLFFPSVLNHSVCPFYTSDEYRISVSGNIKYKVS